MAIEWSGWTRLPGTTDAAPCAHWDGKHVHLHCKGINDRQIYHMAIERDGTHTDWQLASGNFRTTQGVAAATGTPLFALDAFKRVNASANGAFAPVPGGGTTDAAPNALPIGEAIALFCRGIDDNGVYVNLYQNDSAAWSGWSEVPGDGRTRRALTSVVTTDYRVYLHAVGMGGGAYFTSAAAEWSDDRVALRWSGIWQEIPGGLLMHLAMSAAGKDPRNTYGADTQRPSFEWTYLVATNPQGHVVYNVHESVTPARVLAPGRSPWRGWTPIPQVPNLGDFVTDVAPAAALCYGVLPGPPFGGLDILFVFGKLAADNTIWMNRGTVFD